MRACADRPGFEQTKIAVLYPPHRMTTLSSARPMPEVACYAGTHIGVTRSRPQSASATRFAPSQALHGMEHERVVQDSHP